MPKYVAYYRVSTKRQGQSGLGLESQKMAVDQFIDQHPSRQVVAEFTEVESGKYTDDKRPQLHEAIRLCRFHGYCLLVAYLSRLSRNAAFTMALRDSGVSFICADMPDANDLTIGIMAVVAEEERRVIGKRIKDGFAAARARGVKLGGLKMSKERAVACLNSVPRHIVQQKTNKTRYDKSMKFALQHAPIIRDLMAQGFLTEKQIANEFNNLKLAKQTGAIPGEPASGRGKSKPDSVTAWNAADIKKMNAYIGDAIEQGLYDPLYN